METANANNTLTIPIEPIISSGPLTPDDVNSAPTPKEDDDRPLSPTIYTNGRDPVNISAEHLKNHPLHEPTGTSEVLTFYPTIEEFKNFNRYIRKVEQVGSHLKSGIAKIVAPEGWNPRPSKTDFSDTLDYEIAAPSQESIHKTAKTGVYVKYNESRYRKLLVRDYQKMALSEEYSNPQPYLTGKDIENYYFEHILEREPIYGADTEGSFYDANIKEFNMSRLGTILGDVDYEIKGVNTVYLYFGMYKTTFPWHAEDMDLYSINYLHFGEPKYWFAISSEHADRFERFMNQQFSYDNDYAPQCKAFLRHKTSIVTPEVLRAAKIPFATMMQRPNEFIITFPRGYHMGFNLGYNLAESTNFATDRWIDYGKDAVLCDCSKDSVKIDMDIFMRAYRKLEHPAWNAYWFGSESSKWNPIKIKDLSKKRKSAAVIESVSKKIKLGDADVANSDGSEIETSVFIKSLEGYETNYELKPDYEKNLRHFRREKKTLRSNSNVNLFAEREFNQERSKEWPHCAVCQYFQPSHMSAVSTCIPQSSRRLIPTSCFSKTTSNEEQKETFDRLLTCTNCDVVVHSSCCSGDKPAFNEQWKCPRCLDRSDTDVRETSCQLCEFRGGALIPCRIGLDSTYAHVVCALFNRRANFNRADGPTSCFVETSSRQLSETIGMTPLNEEYRTELGDFSESSRWECIVCQQSGQGLTPCVICIEETPTTIPSLSHVTCARRVGYLCEQRDYPRGAVIICHKHENSYLANRSSGCSTLKIGDQVFVDDDTSTDGRKIYTMGNVVSVDKKATVVVDFLDNSCSRDNSIEDIQSCECLSCENGNHQYGSRVKVLWDDKKLYDAYYRGKGKILEYTIGLEDGRLVKHSRSKIKTKRQVNSSQQRNT